MGGVTNVGGNDGTCTSACADGVTTCSSDHMDCLGTKIGDHIMTITCDGKCNDCPNPVYK
jgi:hypothetical protein